MILFFFALTKRSNCLIRWSASYLFGMGGRGNTFHVGLVSIGTTYLCRILICRSCTLFIDYGEVRIGDVTVAVSPALNPEFVPSYEQPLFEDSQVRTEDRLIHVYVLPGSASWTPTNVAALHVCMNTGNPPSSSMVTHCPMVFLLLDQPYNHAANIAER